MARERSCSNRHALNRLFGSHLSSRSLELGMNLMELGSAEVFRGVRHSVAPRRSASFDCAFFNSAVRIGDPQPAIS
jgi:hypothetical protein